MTELTELDKIIHKWADAKIGESFSREALDFSQVKVTARPIVYLNMEERLSTVKHNVEDFTNPSSMPISWAYVFDLDFESHVKWTIQNEQELNSVYIPECSVSLLGPPVDPNLRQMQCQVISSNPTDNNNGISKKDKFALRHPVDLHPYADAQVFTEVRAWNLDKLKWYVDLQLSGEVKIISHKKRKTWVKEEVKAGIEDVFVGVNDFHVYNTFGSSPEVVYKLRGECEGRVLAGWKVRESKLETTV